MILLSELLDESNASEEAEKLGLDYLSFGRYGKNDDGSVIIVIDLNEDGFTDDPNMIKEQSLQHNESILYKYLNSPVRQAKQNNVLPPL